VIGGLVGVAIEAVGNVATNRRPSLSAYGVAFAGGAATGALSASGVGIGVKLFGLAGVGVAEGWGKAAVRGTSYDGMSAAADALMGPLGHGSGEFLGAVSERAMKARIGSYLRTAGDTGILEMRRALQGFKMDEALVSGMLVGEGGVFFDMGR
jgi:hypothetical protein